MIAIDWYGSLIVVVFNCYACYGHGLVGIIMLIGVL